MKELMKNWTYLQLGLLLQALTALGGLGTAVWGAVGSVLVLMGAKGAKPYWDAEGQTCAQPFTVGAILCIAGAAIGPIPFIGFLGSILMAVGYGFELLAALRLEKTNYFAGVPGSGMPLMEWGLGVALGMRAITSVPGLEILLFWLVWPMAMASVLLLLLAWLKMQDCLLSRLGG